MVRPRELVSESCRLFLLLYSCLPSEMNRMIPDFFTPDLVAKGVIDQWTFMTAVNNNTKALALLQQHWSTWITETDFQAIQAAGLNNARIPIPHWAFNGSSTEPYLVGAEFSYISQAVKWAAKYNLDVLLNLVSFRGIANNGVVPRLTRLSLSPLLPLSLQHTAPGSQSKLACF